MLNFDLLVIGGGPGGYVAAIKAAQLNKKVALVENRDLGGTCLNRGCIPTKALVKTAEIKKLSERFEDFGLVGEGAKADILKIQERKNGIVLKLRNGVSSLLNANKISVFSSTATFVNDTDVKVITDGKEEIIRATNIIIATGSKPFKLDIKGSDLDGVITTDELLDIDFLPKEMSIIGAGTVGVEFASVFSALGTKVNMLVRYPRVLRKLDVETIEEFSKHFYNENINLVAPVTIHEINKVDDKLEVLVSDKNNKEIRVKSDVVLMSAGRRINVDNLGLENTSVTYSNKGIVTDDNYQTNVKHIYAIGDVLGKIMLAHVASDQGIKVVEHIFENKKVTPLGPIPDCVFASPEIATVGMSEEIVKEKKLNYTVGKFMFSGNGKALCMSETEGFVKVIVSKDDDSVLGVSIVGPHASDLIHEASLAMTHRISASKIIESIHAHPTLIETFSEATMDAKKKAIHGEPKWMDVLKDEVAEEKNTNVLLMPKLTNLMTQGKVTKILVKENQKVNLGDDLFVVEGPKIVKTITSTVDGIILKILVNENDNKLVGDVLCEFANKEEKNIKMPKLSTLMTNGKVISYMVNVGDKVGINTPIAKIEGGKITKELLSDVEGEVSSIDVNVGDMVAVDTVIITLK